MSDSPPQVQLNYEPPTNPQIAVPTSNEVSCPTSNEAQSDSNVPSPSESSNLIVPLTSKRLSFSGRLMGFGVVDVILGLLTLTFTILWKTVWRSPYDAMSSVMLFLAIVFLVTGAVSLVVGVWFGKHENGDYEYQHCENACSQVVVISTLIFISIVIVGASLNAGHSKHTGAVFKLHFDDYAEKFNIDTADSLKKMEAKSARMIVPTVVFFTLLLCSIVLYFSALIAFKVSAIGSTNAWISFNIAVAGPIIFCICGILVVFSLQMIFVRTPSDYGRTFAAPIPYMAIMSSIVLAISGICFTMHLCQECKGSYEGRLLGLGAGMCLILMALIICVLCIGVTIAQLILGYSHKFDNLGCIVERTFEKVCSGDSGTVANDIDTNGTDGNGNEDEDKSQCGAAIMRGVLHYNLLIGQAVPLEPRSEPPCYNLYNMTTHLVKTAQDGARDLHIEAAWLSVFGLFAPLALLLVFALITFCCFKDCCPSFFKNLLI